MCLKINNAGILTIQQSTVAPHKQQINIWNHGVGMLKVELEIRNSERITADEDGYANQTTPPSLSSLSYANDLNV